MKTNFSRRDFFKMAVAGTAGMLVLPNTSCGHNRKPKAVVDTHALSVDAIRNFGVGLILYTVRDAMVADPVGTLKKVAGMGYRYVELAGYYNRKFYGYSPAEFKKIVNDLGMDIISSHTQVEAEGITLDNAKIMIEDHVAVGVKYCVQPWVVEEARNIPTYHKMVADWNKVGELMKDAGIQFGYHNHNFEFKNSDGIVPYYDIYMKELNKDLVTMELDVFWAVKGGQNPVDIFNKYPGRFELIHCKDMFTAVDTPYYTTDGEKDFAPVGEGKIDFKSIFAAKDVAGVKYFFVEQDLTPDNKPFDAIQKSITNLTTKILA